MDYRSKFLDNLKTIFLKLCLGRNKYLILGLRKLTVNFEKY